jgi:hypothetical protein
MTQPYQTPNPSLRPESFLLTLGVGAGIALLVISFFVFGVDAPSSAWGSYWRIRPLLLTPLAGAAGGAFWAVMAYLSTRGLNKVLAIVLSVLVYLVVLWIGTILGLVGTMWD